ncbi:DUF2079 domain-containing protein [Streptosporangium sp. NBC_01756]|uniref:DUF2079 domain-containing protein n=1 Tax=Streptosporangium sp. NBC_01756 TaxID=2975950 RepID=UPI002DDB0FF0|nr:DUF2079 domain-containing protein [Streptosporangium sp. NBC_01756]WSC83461.1 DUF2079 domain-containing protein [Streptosporangium sp. NBC_01756]
MTTAASPGTSRLKALDVPGLLRSRRHGLVLGGAVVLASAVYSLLGLVKFATFRTSVFDLVIFDQAVRGYADFGPPAVPAVGMQYGLGMGFLQLADHFSPILALLAPLYWLHDGPQTLIVAQAVLFALAAVPIWHYAERRVGTIPAHLVAVAYLVSWPIAQAAGFDFHEVAFVPLLSAIMIERFDAGRPAVGVLAAAGLLLVKEDMGLLLAGFGVYLLLTRRRLEGAALILFALGALVMIRSVLMPMAGAGPTGFHWAYGNWGADLGEVALAVLRNPPAALAQFVSPMVKVNTLAFLLWPMALTALFSPLALVAVPLVAERFLADRSQWWGPEFQYNAFAVAILVCAGVDGAARLAERLRERFGGRFEGRRVITHWAVAICVIGLTLVPRFELGKLLDPAFYPGEPYVAAAREAVARVPDGVVVEAANGVGSALTARTTVLLWGPQSYGAPWVVADVARWSYPFGEFDAQRRRVDEALANGYRKVFEQDGYVVLNRP